MALTLAVGVDTNDERITQLGRAWCFSETLDWVADQGREDLSFPEVMSVIPDEYEYEPGRLPRLIGELERLLNTGPPLGHIKDDLEVWKREAEEAQLRNVSLWFI